MARTLRAQLGQDLGDRHALRIESGAEASHVRHIVLFQSDVGEGARRQPDEKSARLRRSSR